MPVFEAGSGSGDAGPTECAVQTVAKATSATVMDVDISGAAQP